MDLLLTGNPTLYPPGNEFISHLGKLGKSQTQKCLENKGDMIVTRRVFFWDGDIKEQEVFWGGYLVGEVGHYLKIEVFHILIIKLKYSLGMTTSDTPLFSGDSIKKSLADT